MRDDEIAREIRGHLEQEAEDQQADGLSPEESHYAARRVFGNVTRVQEETRAVWSGVWREQVLQDVRSAVRTMIRRPGFAALVIGMLALGIGATTAVFSVVNTVLLTPPAYPAPDQLLVLTTPTGGVQDGRTFHYVRDRTRAFERLAAQSLGNGWNLSRGAASEYVDALAVSADYFKTLDVEPLRGRGFTRAEDQPNGPRAVVVSEALWQRLWHASPDVLGRLVELGGVPHTIVGVMPAAFQSLPPADVWTPLQLSPSDSGTNYRVIGRLRDGVSPAQALGELDTLRPGLVQDLERFPESRAQSLTWMPYQQYLGLGLRPILWLLLAAVACLLGIACVNVASLHLVRAVSRRRELAMRTVLGSGRGRLVRALLTEAIAQALVGAVLGLFVARWGTHALAPLAPEGLLTGPIVFDWRVLGVALGAGLGCGVVFGIVSALSALRVDVWAALREGARQTETRRAQWLRRGFVMAQVALACVLLVGAGLLIRTFVNLQTTELGFSPDDIIVGSMSLQGSATQTRDDLGAFFDEMLGRIQSLPGVEMAAVANHVPVERGVNLPLAPPTGGLVGSVRAVDWRYVTPGYFKLLAIAVRRGRAFDVRDGAGGAPVALVNEAFARAYFGTPDVVGRHIQLVAALEDPPREIVGVVADVRSRPGSGWTRGLSALGAAAPPTMYVPAVQVPDGIRRLVHGYFPVKWIVRTRPGAANLEPAIQQVLRQSDARLPFIRFQSMRDVVGRDVALQRFLMTLLVVFASVALAFAAGGLYGLVSYTVTQRTREIGVRMALGAAAGTMLAAFAREGLTLALLGVGLGIAGSIALTRLIGVFLTGVEPFDPTTLAGVGLLLIVVAAFASLGPARRAARVDPLVALRYE